MDFNLLRVADATGKPFPTHDQQQRQAQPRQGRQRYLLLVTRPVHDRGAIVGLLQQGDLCRRPLLGAKLERTLRNQAQHLFGPRQFRLLELQLQGVPRCFLRLFQQTLVPVAEQLLHDARVIQRVAELCQFVLAFAVQLFRKVLADGVAQSLAGLLYALFVAANLLVQPHVTGIFTPCTRVRS